MIQNTHEASPPDTLADLILRAQSGDRSAEEELIRQNLPLVHAIMRRYAGRGVETDDLRQLGLIGLWKAIRRFDLSYGVRFSTYAVPLIAGEIKRFLRDDGIVKFSRTSKQLLQRISALCQQAEGLCVSELAERLGCASEDIAVALSSGASVASLDAAVADDGMTLGELQAAPDDRETLLNRIYLSELMTRLDKREQLIVQLRYARDMTQKETAARLHISQVQVSRLEKKIMQKLRRQQDA